MTILQKLFRGAESPPADQGPLYPQVQGVMEDVQAYARSHGGRIELVGVSAEGIVTVRMGGACKGCPLADITLKLGIENQLRTLVPGVAKVVALR